MVGVLSDRGYVNEPSTVAETLETEWKATSTEARERVRVAMSMDAEGVFVRATVITEGLSAQKWATEIRTTAVELERALLGSIQPEIAQSSSDADLRVHDYSTAAPVLWDALKRVAAEAGAYFDAYDPPIDTVAATRWIKGAEGETRWRYEARFESRGDGRTRVRVDRAVEKAVGERRWIAEGETRDLSLEWALIERRDPERAMAIEEVARRKAHDAFEEAVARGAPACVGCRGCRGT